MYAFYSAGKYSVGTIEEFDGYGAVYPGRITREGGAVISLTTGDSWKGCLGVFFRFLCVCVCVFGGDEVGC